MATQVQEEEEMEEQPEIPEDDSHPDWLLFSFLDAEDDVEQRNNAPNEMIAELADPAKKVTSGDRRETEESSDGPVTSETAEGEPNLPKTDKQSPAEGEETPVSSEQQVWPQQLNFLQHPCLWRSQDTVETGGAKPFCICKKVHFLR